MADIEAKIAAQGDKIRELKAAKATKDVIQPEVSLERMSPVGQSLSESHLVSKVG